MNPHRRRALRHVRAGGTEVDVFLGVLKLQMLVHREPLGQIQWTNLRCEGLDNDTTCYWLEAQILMQCFSKWAESPPWGRFWWARGRKNQREW